MDRFTANGRYIEAASKAYAYYAPIQEQRRQINAALADIERFEPKSPEWVAAIKRHIDVLNNWK